MHNFSGILSKHIALIGSFMLCGNISDTHEVAAALQFFGDLNTAFTNTTMEILEDQRFRKDKGRELRFLDDAHEVDSQERQFVFQKYTKSINTAETPFIPIESIEQTVSDIPHSKPSKKRTSKPKVIKRPADPKPKAKSKAATK